MSAASLHAPSKLMGDFRAQRIGDAADRQR